jgi:hypothetical protein
MTRLKRFNVLVVHRRAGKTRLAVAIMMDAACREPSQRLAYVAPFLKQAKAVAWEMLRGNARLVPGTVVNESETSVMLPNGSTIRLYGADLPDALRGLRLDGCVLDEVAQMRPEAWGEIIRPALADGRGWGLFIGTPQGINLFSELYQRAEKDPEWFSALYRADQTHAINPEELAALKREMSDSQFDQEFNCSFSAATTNSLIPLSLALEASRRVVEKAQLEFAPKILGVDVARYGHDRTVIILRHGLICYAPRVLRSLDTMTVASHVAEVAEKHSPDAIFVDQGGVGGGVVDRLAQLGLDPIGVDFGRSPIDDRYANRRAEMWWKAKEWLEQGGSLPDDSALVAELAAPTYSYANARGKMQLESKDDMKARGLPSPDIADALACTFFDTVVSRAQRDHVEHRASADADRRRVRNYNPFANMGAA